MTDSNKLILVVDDNRAMRLTLSANLQSIGYDTLEADGGESALELVRENRKIGLVLSDIRMPGINGVDTFKMIKTLRADLPVIMMTAYSVEDLVTEAILEGAYTVIHKPFDVEALFRTISKAIAHPAIMIVDTADDSRELLTGLRDSGCRAVSVATVDEALQMVHDSPIDVALIRVEAPNDGALLALQELRRRDPSIPVIVLSWADVPDLIRRAAELGAYTCLRKPIDMRELMKIIAEVRREF